MRLPLYLTLAVMLFSCNQPSNPKPGYRDSVINNYFAMIDSSGKYDTADLPYKALKAYYYNDTMQLKRLHSFITAQKTKRENWDLWQSDIPLPTLDQLKFDEAYRVVFSIYGAPAYEVITIMKKDTTCKLHYLQYSREKGRGKEFEKSISKRAWDDVTAKLREADFWYLKSERNSRGSDGFDLTVIGYQKWDKTARSHFVHRWGLTSLDNTFYYIYYQLLNKNERVFSPE
jgi:hypothetical protein